MSLPRGLWDRHIALLTGIADVPRPVVAAEVVDLSRYTTSGAGYVGVAYGGALLWAVYRDGPAPQIGDLLQIRRGDAALDARWYAWPLPFAAGCAGQLYVSAARTDTGAWDVLRVDLAVGNVWQRRSASPVSGSYPRRPMHSYLGTRLFTWGSSADLATPGPLYYSDDQGATWTGCGISVSNLAMEMKFGQAFAVGGGTLYQSGDQGATWAAVTGPPGGVYYACATNTSALSDLVTVLTASGVYGCGASAFDNVDAWTTSGHGTPGGAGAWVTGPATGQPEWFTGGTAYRYDAEPATALGTLAGGNDAPGRTYGGGPVYHAATGNGHVYTRANTSFPGVVYDPATDHPSALTGIGARDAFLVSGTATPYLGFDATCLAIALDDTASGTPKLLTRDPEATGDPWQIASTRMVTDLGAEYRISVQGLTTLERWTGAVAG